ncbi:MAG: lysoplasmalogenase [Bacteroidia bacterium]
MKKWPEYLLLLVALLHLILRREDDLLLMGITKSLIMPTVILYYWQGSNQKNGLVFYWILVALILSWLGDIFLIWGAQNLYFMLGMAAFFTAHLCYAAAFSLGGGIGLLQKKPWLALLWLALAAALYAFLFPGLGVMAIPVGFYTLAIVVMVLMAFNRYGRVENTAAVWVIAGAISFMFSDSVLAIHRFRIDIAHQQFLVMPSYIFAQYAIVKGYLGYLNQQ